MENVSIKVEGLTKIYKIYDNPTDRLKESLGLSRKKHYKEYYSLNNISFEVKKGEILGIVGTNGAGKSTLLKILTGVLNPTSGEVYTAGTISALLELGTGFNPEYTGRENIYLYGTMHNKSKAEVDEEIDSIIEFAELKEFIDQPVKTYSSGMFSRLAFSVAINVQPDILIVDEVLSVGDLKFQIKCMDRMKQMMSSGTTVLFVSHDINAIKRFCTKAVWINKGELLAVGPVEQITDRYLDFLKIGDEEIIKESISIENIKEDTRELDEYQKNKNIIAEIKCVRLLNQEGKEVTNVVYNQKTIVEVIYDVHDEKIEQPVLGIAIKAIDDEYICGLNTLLDGVEIPWEEGRNIVHLEYSSGVLALGGEYYLDVALMEQTATVPIEYRSREKSFVVTSGYVAEGKYVIPHKWKGRK